MSGVKEIRYTINGGEEQVILGDFGFFILQKDSLEIRVEYWAIDNAGNVEHWNAFIVHIDKTEPDIIDFYYEVTGGSPERGWEFTFTMVATDYMSGMDRVEFYFNDELQFTEEGPGPTYTWTVLFRPSDYNSFHVDGLISNLEITEEYITFFAILVLITKWQESIYPSAYVYDKAGNYDRDGFYHSPHITITPGIYLFESLTLPNDYDGYIGRFLISAEFNNY